MNSEVPYEDVGSIRSLVKLIDPCVCKQGLYAHPHFPDAVNPEFFFKVERNRTTPFYSHPSLVELPPNGGTSDDEDDNGQRSQPALLSLGPTLLTMPFNILPPYEDLNPDQRLTMAEVLTRLQNEASIFFNEIMPSQIQYSDPWWLSTLERECSGFFCLFRTLVNLENQIKSTRSDAPRTWDPKISDGMYYRPQPPAREMYT